MVALCAIAVFIFFIVFMKAIYAFGVLGFFIALLIALFIFKWINDRRSGSQRIT